MRIRKTAVSSQLSVHSSRENVWLRQLSVKTGEHSYAKWAQERHVRLDSLVAGIQAERGEVSLEERLEQATPIKVVGAAGYAGYLASMHTLMRLLSAVAPSFSLTKTTLLFW